jgi:hypothetical protein
MGAEMHHSTQILADAAEALAYVRVLWLPDDDWDRFAAVVHDMQRAAASLLTGLGAEYPTPGSDVRSTGEPRRTRAASDKLARDIQDKARAGSVVGMQLR